MPSNETKPKNRCTKRDRDHFSIDKLVLCHASMKRFTHETEKML